MCCSQKIHRNSCKLHSTVQVLFRWRMFQVEIIFHGAATILWTILFPGGILEVIQEVNKATTAQNDKRKHRIFDLLRKKSSGHYIPCITNIFQLRYLDLNNHLMGNQFLYNSWNLILLTFWDFPLLIFLSINACNDSERTDNESSFSISCWYGDVGWVPMTTCPNFESIFASRRAFLIKFTIQHSASSDCIFNFSANILTTNKFIHDRNDFGALKSLYSFGINFG